jgi:polysaccharide pyruvyl transferase WcaK-like protein
MKVVMTHLWPESNAGDYAIVRGTIDAIEDASSRPVTFIGLTTFATHSAALAQHFPETLKKGLELRPALIPSYKSDECEQFSRLEKFKLSLRYLAITFLLLVGGKSLARYLVSESQRQTLDDIACADLVVVKGGAFLMGFPGVAGSLYLLRNALTAMWCAKLNRRCIIAPHSFGPFANGLQLSLLRIMLHGIAIYARERISLDLLQRVGLPAKYLPDMAFYFGPQPNGRRSDAQIAITVRPCPTFLTVTQQRGYYDGLATVVTELVNEGFHIVFVPQVSGPDAREDDRQAIEVIRELALQKVAAPERIAVVNPATLHEKFRIYSESTCCVGTRMHSVIFSCLTATKVVALAYLGPKHRGIMDELELGEFVLDITNLSAEQLLRSIHEALSRQSTAKTTERVGELRAQIQGEFRAILHPALQA